MSEGLDRAMLLPSGHGHLQLSAVAVSEGIAGRLEALHRWRPNFAGFAYGELDNRLRWSAGAGVRVSW